MRPAVVVAKRETILRSARSRKRFFYLHLLLRSCPNDTAGQTQHNCPAASAAHANSNRVAAQHLKERNVAMCIYCFAHAQTKPGGTSQERLSGSDTGRQSVAK